jgi:hypothetical protein
MGLMKDAIHITDTKRGLDGEFYLVSRAWMRAVSVIVALILGALVFLGWRFYQDHTLALDSQEFRAADRELNQALNEAFQGREKQINILHTQLCEALQALGKTCKPLPPVILNPTRYGHVLKADGSGFVDGPATLPTPTP